MARIYTYSKLKNIRQFASGERTLLVLPRYMHGNLDYEAGDTLLMRAYEDEEYSQWRAAIFEIINVIIISAHDIDSTIYMVPGEKRRKQALTPNLLGRPLGREQVLASDLLGRPLEQFQADWDDLYRDKHPERLWEKNPHLCLMVLRRRPDIEEEVDWIYDLELDELPEEAQLHSQKE